MSVENLNHITNCNLTYPVVRQNEQRNIKLEDSAGLHASKWSSETRESFITPIVEDKKIGKRRELLMKYFRLRASKEVLEEIIGEPPLPGAFLSEYINNFCDNDFIPLLENSEFDIQKLAKNPLYGGNERTYYKEQFDKGNMKSTTEVRNKKRPFSKRSLFTTPPEIALDEPVDGF